MAIEHRGENTPTVSMVIVAFRNRHDLPTCLASIAAACAKSEEPYEVIVVDNASDDGTADVVEQDHPWVRLLRSDVNLGFGRAANLGARAARADLILHLNPDTELLPGSLEALLDLARRRPDAGLYGGRTVTPDGQLDPRSAWGRPTMWSLLCFGTGLSSIASGSRLFDPESLGGWKRDSEREVPVVTGCLLLARRSVWERLGGFDPRFFMYGEDADLSMRAWAAGYRPVISPDAVVVHALGGSSTTSATRWSMVLRGKSTLVRRHFTGGRRRIALSMLWTGVAARAALATIGRIVRRSLAEPHWPEVWSRRAEWLPGWQAVGPIAPTPAPAAEE